MSEYESMRKDYERMKDNELKRYFVAHRQEIKERLPTSRECEIIDFVRRNGKTGSDDIADRFNISVQNANASLVKLWRKGYFDRRDVGHQTGGSYYQYEINF